MPATLKSSFLALLGSAALGCTGLMAGSFTSDFGNPNQSGISLASNGAARPDSSTFNPTIESGRLTLTYAEPGEQGTILLNDLDAGAAIKAFTATFKLRIGGGTSNPGDGLAFYFGSDVSEGMTFAEEGPESMANGVAVCFDIYNNGNNEAPAIDVKVNGQVVATSARDIFSLLSDTFVDVSIQLKEDGTLTVSHRGTAIFTDLFLPGFAPAPGARFSIGARTGAEFANHWVDDLSITTTLAGAAVQPSIASNPANVSVNEGQPATFKVGYTGTMPFAFQWYKGESEILDATNNTYRIAAAAGADNGTTYKCKVSNGQGSATSQPATLTVIVDTTKPTLTSAKGSDTFDKVTVVFSEPVDDTSAQTPGNYTLTGTTVTGAAKTSANTVVLTTTRQAEGATLTLTVNNVKDKATNPNTIEANSTISLRTFVFSPGFTKLDIWDGVTGAAVEVLFEDANYIAGIPSRTAFAVGYDSDTAPIGLDGVNENYGAVMSGYIIPAQSGQYRFFSRSDDASQLFLSTDSNPANAVLIAQEATCCQAFLEPGNPVTSEPYQLAAGTRYFMKLIFKEATGGDYGQVAWRREGDSTPAASLSPVGGLVVGWFADPAGATINVTTPPANTQTTENKTATFAVVATGTPGPVWYQWQRAEPGSDTFVNIANARTATYTTPAMKRATDNGARYRAMVYTPGLSQPSAAATLTVDIDSTGPSVVRAITKPNNKGVILKFSEPVASAAAANSAAYTIAGLNVTAARFVSPDMVVLTTTPMTEGASYTVVVGNTVTDIAIPPNGAAAPNNTASFKGQIKVVGASKFEMYNAIGGAAITDLTGNSKYPYSPDKVTLCNGMESPSFVHIGDNYGGRLSGFFVPATTDDYVFYISTDDSGAFYVSTDDDPDNVVLRATEPQYGGARVWTGNAAGRRPGCDSGACENISAPIHMEAGKAYYMELLFKEGGGNDCGAVRVQLASEAAPAEGSFLPPLDGVTLYGTIDPSALETFTLPAGDRSPLGSGLTDGFNVKPYQAHQVGSNPVTDQYQNFEQVLAGALGPNVANLASAVNGVIGVNGVINFNDDSAAEAGFFDSVSTGVYLSPDQPMPGIPGVGTYGGVAARAHTAYAEEVTTYVEFPTPGVYFFGVNSQNGFRVSAGHQPPTDTGALVVHGGSAAGTYYALDAGVDFSGGISKNMTAKISGKAVLADPVPACSALANPTAIAGNIAVVERGVCVFSGKLQAAKDAGAVAVIVINSRDPGNAEGVWPIVMGGTYVDIPAVMVSKPDGVKLKNSLLAGETVHVSIAPMLDQGLGFYNRGRSTFETRFVANVKEAGLYPLRMVSYFMSTDTAQFGDVEFFSHTLNDDYILLNDRSKTGALKTYRTRNFVPLAPSISITTTGGAVTINYVGVLQASDTVNGTYMDVAGAGSPYTVSAPNGAKFYRARGL